MKTERLVIFPLLVAVVLCWMGGRAAFRDFSRGAAYDPPQVSWCHPLCRDWTLRWP